LHIQYLQTERSEVRIPAGAMFLCSQMSRTSLGLNQPPIQRFPGFLPGVRRRRREADHSGLVQRLKTGGTCSLLIHLPGVKSGNCNFRYIMILEQCRRVLNQQTAALLFTSGRTWLRCTVTLHHSSRDLWWRIAACHST